MSITTIETNKCDNFLSTKKYMGRSMYEHKRGRLQEAHYCLIFEEIVVFKH